MIATIKHRSFIPSEAVSFPPVLAQVFNGGTKGELVCTIDMDGDGPSALTLVTATWHESVEYSTDSSEQVPSKPDWFHRLKSTTSILGRKTLVRDTENLNATWKVEDSGTHGVFLLQDGGNPLLPAITPNINAEILVLLRMKNGNLEYRIKGDHDGFPAYEIVLNDTVVWNYDPVAADEGPSDLFPAMDHSIELDWKAL